MEAMASGLPVICSDIRGNIDLIDNQMGGYLVDPQDIEGFISSIASLVNDKLLCEKMGKYNLGKIKMFEIDLIKVQMENLYNEVLNY